ncbi:hypothetical protein SAMN02927914_01374 [Mesorhizobium qingshengii]|uniref:Uncharacterized protein n=1 Tax=Mesorhizobium qingshengii TaxID=1165689 RepID=A0A1G5WIH2_9HYPH|nr:hypothetical protein SAMN02927914_01374 [Mesorhizobium qingshengii]
MPAHGVGYHLPRFARIGPHEEHMAVGKPRVRKLHRYRHAIEQNDLVAPVELVGLACRKGQPM